MKYSEAKQGRVFVIRLEDGDIVHEEIENFAREKDIRAAALIAVGGADDGSNLVVGPRESRAESIDPMQQVLSGAHEIAGTGTLFPDKDGNPILHMHMSCGRNATAITGCVRGGVKTWHVLEIILMELADSTGARILDPVTGFELLEP